MPLNKMMLRVNDQCPPDRQGELTPDAASILLRTSQLLMPGALPESERSAASDDLTWVKGVKAHGERTGSKSL